MHGVMIQALGNRSKVFKFSSIVRLMAAFNLGKTLMDALQFRELGMDFYIA